MSAHEILTELSDAIMSTVEERKEDFADEDAQKDCREKTISNSYRERLIASICTARHLIN